MGFGRTRNAARQLVNHGHILVNGKKVDIASFSVKPGMTIEVKETSKGLDLLRDSLEATLNTVDFVTVDKEAKKGTFVRYPERNELNAELNEALVVEFYNR
jgi:small subunit ribosomal protein S4